MFPPAMLSLIYRTGSGERTVVQWADPVPCPRHISLARLGSFISRVIFWCCENQVFRAEVPSPCFRFGVTLSNAQKPYSNPSNIGNTWFLCRVFLLRFWGSLVTIILSKAFLHKNAEPWTPWLWGSQVWCSGWLVWGWVGLNSFPGCRYF